MSDDNKPIRCTWDGCWRTTWQPYTDGWSGLAGWPAPIKDGWYCKQHADAIEAVDATGGLDGRPAS